jgi:hypothetical protein
MSSHRSKFAKLHFHLSFQQSSYICHSSIFDPFFIEPTIRPTPSWNIHFPHPWQHHLLFFPFLTTCTTHLKILMLEILCLWNRMILILFPASCCLIWECMSVWKIYW